MMQKDKRENIHDSNFKHNFSQKNVAQDFLTYNLPKSILEKIAIESIAIESTEFIPSKYRGSRNADIIYSLKDKKENRIYALLHLEAQSTHKKGMAIRVWEYHLAIAKAHMRKEGSDKIPLILSYVFYNGSQKWTSPTSIADLFTDFDQYVAISLKSSFLVNISESTIEELKNQGASAAPQMIMRGKVYNDYCTRLEELYLLMEQYGQDDDENIDYMANNDKHGEEKFLEKLSILAPDNTQKYNIMFARASKRSKQEGIEEGMQKGIQEGRQQGIQEGRQQGIQEGIQKGIQQATLHLIEEFKKLGVSKDIIEKVQKIT